MAMPDRQQMEADIERIKRELAEMRDAMGERVWRIEQEGQRRGPAGHELYTEGAPTFHPVWADELREQAAQARSQGEPILRNQPYEVDDDAWPPAGHYPLRMEAQTRRLGLSHDERLRESDERWARIDERERER